MGAYHRPVELSDALGLLAKGPMTVAAGCTDLFPATSARALSGDVLDLTDIGSLRSISQTPEGWRIGAGATWTDILHADLPPAFDALKQAAYEVGSVQIQNSGTLAGNLCTASPAGDGAPCLRVLDAAVELRSATAKRQMPLQDFLTGARQTTLQPDEILTAILIPQVAGAGKSQFEKLGARKYLVISIAMVAVRLVVADDQIAQAAIAVGSCSPTATRLPELEHALRGVPGAKAAGHVRKSLVAPELAPIDDIRADKDYRLDATVELIRRGLSKLAAP